MMSVLVSSRVEAWREIKNNIAALVALLTNKWQRRALDMGVGGQPSKLVGVAVQEKNSS